MQRRVRVGLKANLRRGPGWREPVCRLAGLGLCLSLLSGCGIGFLWHVSVGQLSLLSRRQPVEEALQGGGLSAKERDKLHLILDVRRFAIEHLGLHADDSYTTFVDVGGPFVSYNVSAAPKDALEPYIWRFPIVGQVPYKGYFKKPGAIREAQKLKEQGYDTYVRGVRAYSTLGYFNDPILSSMLAYPDFALIQTIIHELVHQTVWINGSVSFNESLASFVADKGARAYLTQRDGEASPAYRHYVDIQADNQVFRTYMHGVVKRLEALYQRPLSREEKLHRREVVFAEARDQYPKVFPQMRTQWYRRYFKRRPLNNAVLLSFRRYNQDMSFFETALASHNGDLSAMLMAFQSLRAEDIPAVFQTP